MPIAATSNWYSAAKLAGLPGMPRTKRKVNELALAEGWASRVASDGTPLSRPRAGRGGGTEYHLDLLPESARRKLAGAPAPASAPTPVTEQDRHARWAEFEQQSAKTRGDAADRLKAIQQFERLVAMGSSRSAAAMDVVATLKVARGSLFNWLAAVKDVPAADRLPYLASNYQGGRPRIEIDPEAYSIIQEDFLCPEKPSWASCYRRLSDNYAKPRGIALPEEGTLLDRLRKDFGDEYIKAKRYGMEAVRKSLPHQRRTVASLHAMEAVNIDGHTFDVFVEWHDGTIGRPVMVGIQCVMSRKLLAHRIGETEDTILTRGAFLDLFRDYGIPKDCVLDNGRAFASKAITGGTKTRFRFKVRADDLTGILPALDVKVHFTLPYRGSSKPIERAWRDLCDDVAKHPAVRGAYTGNKPDAKPENYRERAIPIDEFKAHVARRIAAHNARLGRRTEMAKGRSSFDQVFAASFAIAPIGKASPAQMRMAMLTAEARTCDRKTGEISLDGNRYYDDALKPFAGKKVAVRFDPDNLHSSVHVYTLSDDYICEAPVIADTGFFSREERADSSKDARELTKRIRAVDDQRDRIDGKRLAKLLADPDVPAPTPQPGAHRIVRHQRTATALKPIHQAASQPDDREFQDFLEGAERVRLRLVEE